MAAALVASAAALDALACQLAAAQVSVGLGVIATRRFRASPFIRCIYDAIENPLAHFVVLEMTTQAF